MTVFRAICLAWAVIGVWSERGFLARPWAAVGLLTLMALWTAAVSLWPRWGSLLPIDRLWVHLTELGLGAAVLIGDSFVYDPGRGISLPWSWPAAGVMAVGLVRGWRAGLAASLAMVGASLITEFRLDTNLADPVQAFSRIGLWAVTGLLAGYVSSRLRRAEAEVALAHAREEVARQLHDGVLQTLAVIQRRSDDTELAALARDQESDLRRFLSGGRSAGPAAAAIADDATGAVAALRTAMGGEGEPVGLEPGLRLLAQRHERLFPGTTVSVVVAPDAPRVRPDPLEAVLGAAGEALTNVGKHAEADRVTVYAEPADEDDVAEAADRLGIEVLGRRRPTLFLSIKDNGRGFDPAAATERIGLSRSIRGRLTGAGGLAEIASRPGRGTEVRLWIEA
ncbi:MAG: hypothetical protein AAF962_25575 [Actinomycetota bacterium]